MTSWIEIAGEVLRIPNGWDVFVFRGVVYVRHDAEFVVSGLDGSPGPSGTAERRSR
jgi:hypothetical protein